MGTADYGDELCLMILWQEKEEDIFCGNNMGNRGTLVNIRHHMLLTMGNSHYDYKLCRHVKICLINKVFSPSVLTLRMAGMSKGCCLLVIISERPRGIVCSQCIYFCGAVHQ